VKSGKTATKQQINDTNTQFVLFRFDYLSVQQSAFQDMPFILNEKFQHQQMPEIAMNRLSKSFIAPLFAIIFIGMGQMNNTMSMEV